MEEIDEILAGMAMHMGSGDGGAVSDRLRGVGVWGGGRIMSAVDLDNWTISFIGTGK